MSAILGLDEITFAELKSSTKLIDAIQAKLGDMDISQYANQEVARKVSLLTELLKETLLDRYQDVSVRAFAHFTVVLDYFLTLREEGPDSIKDTYPDGYIDDLKRLNDVFNKFDREITAFVKWKQRQAAE
jgi:hypothetical protein